jgi:HNH endonuclease
MAKAVFPEPIWALVMQRSTHCCEYCKSQDRFSPVYFTIDHIIPPVLGGTNDLDNLAYACPLCNRLKWGKITAFDPVTILGFPFITRDSMFGKIIFNGAKIFQRLSVCLQLAVQQLLRYA